jgi:RING finger/CHY zinc finger protein 1
MATRNDGDSTGMAEPFNCKHYKRKCAIVSPCCGKVYPCRLCHNDSEAHEIDRKKVVEVVCLVCEDSSRQPALPTCAFCGTLFAEYFCSICKLWDDDGFKKKIYHCEGCGICRIGPRDKYFHCEKCCACYPTSLEGKHVCISGAMQNNCPICLEDMFSSRRPVVILRCGHNVHAHCQRVMHQMEILQSIRCPTCCKTIAEEPQEIWKEIENHIEQHPMPEEIRGMRVSILCNDCNTKSTEVPLNLIAMKCQSCGGYNTNRV